MINFMIVLYSFILILPFHLLVLMSPSGVKDLKNVGNKVFINPTSKHSVIHRYMPKKSYSLLHNIWFSCFCSSAILGDDKVVSNSCTLKFSSSKLWLLWYLSDLDLFLMQPLEFGEVPAFGVFSSSSTDFVLGCNT